MGAFVATTQHHVPLSGMRSDKVSTGPLPWPTPSRQYAPAKDVSTMFSRLTY
jgi:hypothetical protein